ncbi:MAG: glycosyltransferase family 2 protein [Bacteroidales bacterium]|nr:glycosyltransferase family 2 protein [Bacteroidales bacterium]
MEELKLAVVILNWNGKKFLEKFLPTVLKHNPSYAEVFVADNGSTDQSVEFLSQSFPDVKLIELGRNYGYTGGYNRALRQIKAEYFILLNSDIEVSSGWIEPVVNAMDANRDIAACQPRILSYYKPEYFEYAGAAGGFIDYLGYPFCRGRVFSHLEQDTGQYDNAVEIFWATGACMFVRAADFFEAGALDDSFFAHMEEIDLCWRLKRTGKKIMYIPESKVFHVGGGTLPKNNPRKTYLNFRNNMLLLAKNLPASVFYPLLFKRIILDKIAAVQFLFKGHVRDSWAVYRAVLSVLKNLRKARNQGKDLPYKKVWPVYKRSIVKRFFILRVKKFSDLNPAHFSEL